MKAIEKRKLFCIRKSATVKGCVIVEHVYVVQAMQVPAVRIVWYKSLSLSHSLSLSLCLPFHVIPCMN